nr:unnamed protein product [Digitaria exilis]
MARRTRSWVGSFSSAAHRSASSSSSSLDERENTSSPRRHKEPLSPRRMLATFWMSPAASISVSPLLLVPCRRRRRPTNLPPYQSHPLASGFRAVTHRIPAAILACFFGGALARSLAPFNGGRLPRRREQRRVGGFCRGDAL